MSREVHRLGPHCYLWHKPIISIFRIFLPKVIESSFLCKFTTFCLMCTCVWKLKTMPVNNEDAQLVIFEVLFESPPCFQMFLKLARYIYWQLTKRPSDEMEPANQGSAENDETEKSKGEDIAEHDVPSRPQRQRRPPQILTYNSLGNPQYQSVEPVFSRSFVNPIQAPVAAAIHPGAPLYFWVWPWCLQPAYY